MEATLDRMMSHICQGTVTSPYVSLTRSYGVALAYALVGREDPTASDPSFICEVELSDPLPANVRLIDPVQEVAAMLPPPHQSLTYQHNGPQGVLSALLDGDRVRILGQPCPVPPGTSGVPMPPYLSRELQTLAFALRDAEIIAIGSIPASRIRARYDVY